jgi:hypothetical protein
MGIHMEINKSTTMIINSTDLFVLIEINNDDVKTTEPMTMDNLVSHASIKYGDQPLRYFNEHKRLKAIHLKSGMVKDLKLTIEF